MRLSNDWNQFGRHVNATKKIPIDFNFDLYFGTDLKDINPRVNALATWNRFYVLFITHAIVITLVNFF